MALPEMQEAFCRAYALHGIGAKAAREAGYSKSTATGYASALLKKANVQARIAQIKKESATGAGISPEYLAQKLRYYIDWAETPENTRKDYIKLAMQWQGMLIDRTEFSAVDALTDEELADQAAATLGIPRKQALDMVKFGRLPSNMVSDEEH